MWAEKKKEGKKKERREIRKGGRKRGRGSRKGDKKEVGWGMESLRLRSRGDKTSTNLMWSSRAKIALRAEMTRPWCPCCAVIGWGILGKSGFSLKVKADSQA